MPIYEFCCERHGSFEVVQPMNANRVAHCPVCKRKARRVFTPPGIRCNGFSKMGKTRSELFQNLGKEGWADRDMWKWDKDQLRQKAYLERRNN